LGGKEYSLIWISEFCLKDDESGFMALSELKSRIRGIPDILNIHIKHRENPEFLENSEIHIRLYSFPPSEPRATLLAMSNAKSISTTVFSNSGLSK
jgi:hypothetical protein